MPSDSEEPVYRCPGEAYTIPRAIHLGRLAAFYPKCRECRHNADVGSLVARSAQRLRWARIDPPRPAVLYEDALCGIYLNDLDRSTARNVGLALADYLAPQRSAESDHPIGQFGRSAISAAHGVPHANSGDPDVGDLPPGQRSKTLASSLVREAPPSLPGCFVVGRDLRLSSTELVAGVAEGLRMAGHQVLDLGVSSTPCLQFAVARAHARGGVMITGGPRPAHFNGFKLVGPHGRLLTRRSGLDEIQAALSRPPAPTASAWGSVEAFDPTADYLRYLLQQVETIRSLRVVADGMNGMVGRYLPALFERLPCTLVPLRMEPTAVFPDRPPDPDQPGALDTLTTQVAATGAALGVCFDGDAATARFIDDLGRLTEPVGLAKSNPAALDPLVAVIQLLNVLSKTGRRLSEVAPPSAAHLADLQGRRKPVVQG